MSDTFYTESTESVEVQVGDDVVPTLPPADELRQAMAAEHSTRVLVRATVSRKSLNGDLHSITVERDLVPAEGVNWSQDDAQMLTAFLGVLLLDEADRILNTVQPESPAVVTDTTKPVASVMQVPGLGQAGAAPQAAPQAQPAPQPAAWQPGDTGVQAAAAAMAAPAAGGGVPMMVAQVGSARGSYPVSYPDPAAVPLSALEPVLQGLLAQQGIDPNWVSMFDNRPDMQTRPSPFPIAVKLRRGLVVPGWNPSHNLARVRFNPDGTPKVSVDPKFLSALVQAGGRPQGA